MKLNFLKSGFWISFFLIIIASWVYIYNMSVSMGFDLLGKNIMSMKMKDMDMGSIETFAMLLPMWSIMMLAMMLPAMVPTFITYQDLIKSYEGTWKGWIGILIGYIFIWIFFSFNISILQTFLQKWQFLNNQGILKSNWLTVFLLVAVGFFQFTQIKNYCHSVCSSPFIYFMKKWRSGFIGGIKMGLGLGFFCVGCCWGFMSLAFIMGYMNFIWMGLITFIVILEKIPEIGKLIKKPLGILILLIAIYFILNNLLKFL